MSTPDDRPKLPGCPDPSAVHTGKEASVYTMVVVTVPGRPPVMVTTPRYCVDLPADAAPAGLVSVIDDLVGAAIKGAVDLAAEVRAMFRPSTKPDKPKPEPSGGSAPQPADADRGGGGRVPGGP